MLWGVPSSPTPEQPPGTGIPDSKLPGPYPVGEYAAALRTRLRAFARVQVMGEIVNLRPSRAKVYFELRDSGGALPCSAWRAEWESMCARAGGAPVDGMQVVLAGGCDYYAGSGTSSPGFSFAVNDLRVAGEGDLLARIDRLRKQLDQEGLLGIQQELARELLPRTIGVITGEGGKARDDVLAALTRRGWAGRLVRAFTPVQDRHAAPAIVRALGDLASLAEVDVIIVARGAGSLADLLALLRRDALPHRGPAACARDRVGGPPHRPHPSRRRGGGELLDPDTCGRGRRRYRLHQGASRPGRGRGPPSRPRPPGGARARPAPGDALAGTRSPHLRRTARDCISSCARSVPDRAVALRARAA